MNAWLTGRSRRRHPNGSLLLLVCLVLAFVTGLAPARPAAGQESPEVVAIGPVRLTVDAVGVDATTLADAHRVAISTAVDELTAIFAVTPPSPIDLSFGETPAGGQAEAMNAISTIAWVANDGAAIRITLDGFLRLTPVEAENLLRNALSRAWMRAASKGTLPAGYATGIALYIERPVLARQARLGSLVQRAYQAGTLPDLPTLIDGSTDAVDAETLDAARYALVSFYVDRYGVGSLRDLVQAFATEKAWQAATEAALGQTLDDIDVAWRDFLPVFFASGWRANAVAAFDLGPAEALFDRGAYAAAADQAERSQRLFSELGDQTRLSRVEALLAQCAVGVQAEKIMTDVQAALEGHDYDRAGTLLAQADELYAVLPEAHRPAQTLSAWNQIVADGQSAIARLDEANGRSGNWLLVRQTRTEAREAGLTFAALGDEARLAQAQQLVNDLDYRLRALILSLVGVTLVAGTWSAVWLWARSPARLHWARVQP